MREPSDVKIDIVIPVFNGGQDIVKTICGITEQKKFEELVGAIIVVDDASSDDTYEVVKQLSVSKIKLIRNQTNSGRSSSRNIGVSYADSECILFIDADCHFLRKDILCEIAQRWGLGKRLCFGYATSRGGSFWSLYQKKLARDRKVSRDKLQQTTACFICARSLFNSVGGFSKEYIEYGFEDRDLFIRLFQEIELQKIDFNENIMVEHSPPRDLVEVASKLYKAGRFTSGIFMQQHPQEYLMMSYSKCDSRLIVGKLNWFLSLFSRFWFNVAKAFNPLLNVKWLPFGIKKKAVQFVSAISFFQGTLEADKNRPTPTKNANN